jgi:hypothetical protein
MIDRLRRLFRRSRVEDSVSAPAPAAASALSAVEQGIEALMTVAAEDATLELFLQPSTKGSMPFHSAIMQPPHAPTRVTSLHTAPASAPGIPDELNMAIFQHQSFKVGVCCGYYAIEPERSEQILDAQIRIDADLSLPTGLKERTRAAKAEYEHLEFLEQERLEELSRKRDEARQAEQELARCRAARDAAAEDRAARLRQLREQREAENRAAAEAAKAAPGEAEHVPLQPLLPLLLTAALLLLAAGVFFISDVALSVAAIDILGFDDAAGGWNAVILDLSAWPRYWDAVFICFAIASLTFIFKLLYDIAKYPPVKSRTRLERLYLVGIALGAWMLNLALAELRAQYVVANQMAELQIDSAHVHFSFFVLAALFPLFGAICFSESFERFAQVWQRTVGRRARERKLQREGTGEHEDLVPEESEALDLAEVRLRDAGSALNAAEDAVAQTEELVRSDQRKKLLLQNLLPVWQEQVDLLSSEKRWEAYRQRDLALHRCGYEYGSALRVRADGPDMALEILLRQLPLAGVNGSVPPRPPAPSPAPEEGAATTGDAGSATQRSGREVTARSSLDGAIMDEGA